MQAELVLRVRRQPRNRPRALRRPHLLPLPLPLRPIPHHILHTALRTLVPLRGGRIFLRRLRCHRFRGCGRDGLGRHAKLRKLLSGAAAASLRRGLVGRRRGSLTRRSRGIRRRDGRRSRKEGRSPRVSAAGRRECAKQDREERSHTHHAGSARGSPDPTAIRLANAGPPRGRSVPPAGHSTTPGTTRHPEAVQMIV